MTVYTLTVATSVGLAIATAATKPTALEVSLASDLLTVDGLKPATYRTKGTERPIFRSGTVVAGDVASWPLQHVLKRQVGWRTAMASGGRILVGDALFEVLRMELPLVPRSGDQLLRAGETWTVVAFDDATLETRWRIYGRRT